MSVTQQQIDTLRAAGSDAQAVLKAACEVLPGQVAVLSSFGAESALLLALAAEVDPAIPVLFLETGMHFPETIEYRHELARTLGLLDVIDVRPSERTLQDRDPEDSSGRSIQMPAARCARSSRLMRHPCPTLRSLPDGSVHRPRHATAWK